MEETFHTLKSDLDIRPVYHKSDEGIKVHQNLSVLPYWLVSVTRKCMGHRLLQISRNFIKYLLYEEGELYNSALVDDVFALKVGH